MDTMNCKICGRLFIYQNGQPLCMKCLKILDQKFDKVKEYLYDNPGASLQQVSNENDVSVQQIKKWVRQERLEFTKDSQMGVDCEICGTIIKTGHFCKSCKDDLAIRLGKAYDKPVPEDVRLELQEKCKMRFLDGLNSRY